MRAHCGRPTGTGAEPRALEREQLSAPSRDLNDPHGTHGTHATQGTKQGPLTVRLLGPLDLAIGRRPVVLTAGRLRTMLAVLALSAGRTVPVERLACSAWPDDRPGNVRRSVQTYLSRLRSALGTGAIVTKPTGYVLNTDPDHVDVLRFLRLLGNAADASDTAMERAWLAEALGLWRGDPFEGVPSEQLEETETPWLLERYLAALERRIDLDIAAGKSGRLISELSELTARHPLRESLWARLLVALDRCGRRADALAKYEEIRVRIAIELGVDPDATLQAIHSDLLTRRIPRTPRTPGTPGTPRTPA